MLQGLSCDSHCQWDHFLVIQDFRVFVLLCLYQFLCPSLPMHSIETAYGKKDCLYHMRNINKVKKLTKTSTGTCVLAAILSLTLDFYLCFICNESLRHKFLAFPQPRGQKGREETQLAGLLWPQKHSGKPQCPCGISPFPFLREFWDHEHCWRPTSLGSNDFLVLCVSPVWQKLQMTSQYQYQTKPVGCLTHFADTYIPKETQQSQ